MRLNNGLGITNVAQHAMNRIWGVPIYARPGFFPRTAQSFAVLATIGLGVLAATVWSGIGDRFAPGLGARVVIDVVAIICYVGLFTLAFQVLVGVHIPWRDLLPGAIAAAVAWELFQTLGVLYVSRVLQGMSQVYGLFALVLPRKLSGSSALESTGRISKRSRRSWTRRSCTTTSAVNAR
jgi:membrane protein